MTKLKNLSLAALGGIGAAPFIPVEPVMGDRFLMQGFITVVIGGMGSTTGAAIGALLLGLARAFGDYLALKFSLTPAISEASICRSSSFLMRVAISVVCAVSARLRSARARTSGCSI